MLIGVICFFFGGSKSLLLGQNLQLSFHQINEADGLGFAENYHLTRDAQGLVWIGTEEGLLTFDGRRLHKYEANQSDPRSLMENGITSQCFEDRQGNLWFTTQHSLSCYFPKTDDFEYFQIEGTSAPYRAFHLQEDTLWIQIGVGKSGALYWFEINSQTFRQQGPLEGESCFVVPTQKGTVQELISTSLPNESGLIWTNLLTQERQKVEFVKTAEGIQRAFPSPTKGCYVDEQGIAWVGVYNGMGKYVPGEAESIIFIQREPQIEEDIGWVNAIGAYDDHHLLVATDHGLLVFDRRTESFVQQFRANQGENHSLRTVSLNGLLLDETKTVWLSSPQNELAFAQLGKRKFSSLSLLENKTIASIQEDQHGRIWCSTQDSGTYVFDPDQTLLFRTTLLQNTNRASGFNPLPAIHFFIEDDPSGWWGNLANYFFHWKKGQQQFEIKPSYFFGVKSTDANRINYCYQLSDGTQLMARGDRLYELSLTEARVDTLPWYNVQFLNLGIITVIQESPQGHIFLGDKQGRLVGLQKSGNSLTKIADIQDVGIISAMEADPKRNLLWITSSKGLGKLDLETFAFQLLDQESDGAPQEPLTEIELDAIGGIWLAGNQGLIRFWPDSKHFHRFGLTDGLLSPVSSPHAMLTSSQTGEIWIGGKKGVNVFQPADIHLLQSKPKLRLSQCWINDETYEEVAILNHTKSLTLPYEENTLSFEFAALDYSDPDANQYVVQMVGHDEIPVDQGTRTFIRYGNLPAGRYQFNIWATNSDGVMTDDPLSIKIRIIPPFYQTWWFYVLSLMGISAILYGIFRYRLEQALKVERLRVKISSDLHDDVGGILSGLAMQSELLEITANEDRKPKLARLAELSRSAMSRMRDTVWAIDARKDKLENLLDRMHEHAEETLSPKGIQYKFEIENLDLKTNLPSDVRQNLYLIYKEAITNAAKHSTGNQVWMKLEKNKSGIEMNIKDNGKVAEKSYTSSGLGLSNMRMRAEQIGASLTTSMEDGFHISLKMRRI